MSNKVKYGLKNVHYVPITEVNGKPQYGTPIAHPGAVSLSLQAEGEKLDFEADDTTYYEETSNSGYTGELELALIHDHFRKNIMGETEDSNGALFENSEAKFTPFALMYEFMGDVNATRHILYNCNAARPEVASKTKGKSIEVSAEKLTISARPAIDTKDVKAKLTKGQTGYDTFFSAVYLKNAPLNTATVTTEVFSKAAPADVEIDTTSTATNAITNVRLDGSLIPGIFLTVTGLDVAIDSSYVTTLDIGAYSVSIEYEKGNAVTVALNVTA